MNILLDQSIVIELCAPLGDSAASDLQSTLDAVRASGGRLWIYTGQTGDILEGLTARLPMDVRPGAVLAEFSEQCQWLATLSSDLHDTLTADNPMQAMLEEAVNRIDGEVMILSLDEALIQASENVMAPADLPQPQPKSQMDFVDLKTQQDRIRPGIEKRLHTVLHHGKYIMGPEIAELEARLTTFTGARHAMACSNGTDALILALMAYGVGPGDAVFTTPFTFFATPESIALLGATPVFVDVDPITYNIDPDKLESAVSAVKAEGRLTPRGIMPVDLFGLSADYDSIQSVADRHGLFIIQDACQSFGAEYKGRKAPTLGDIGATSFFPAKPMGCYGDAGAVFTDNTELYEKLISIRIHGMSAGADKYNNVRIGLNARCNTLQAAILLEKLTIYPQEIILRNTVASRYIDRLAGVADASRPSFDEHGSPNTDHSLFQLPAVPDGYSSVWAQFCPQSSKRTEIRAALNAAGIPSPIYYIQPMHLLDAMRYLGYKEGDMPIAEALSKNMFALPMHPYLDEQDINKICDIICPLIDTDYHG